MNLKKIGLLVFIFAFVAFAVFAQTTDEYIVVELMANSNDTWRFSFSNDRFTLANSTDTNYAKALAQLLNYMFRNNYVVVLNEFSGGSYSCVIFRKK